MANPDTPLSHAARSVALRRDASALIAGAGGEKAIAATGEVLGALMQGRMLVSTVFDGPRPDEVGPDVAADLDSLSLATDGALSRDPAIRDAASPEPVAMTLLRQLEGKPPAVAAALVPGDDGQLAAARGEAIAAGYPLHLTGGERAIGLLPPAAVTMVEPSTRRVRISAGASWSDFDRAVATMDGIAPGAVLQDPFPTPFDAALAGHLPRAVLEPTIEGRPWAITAELPPTGCGLIDRTWVYEDGSRASEAFERLVALHGPDYAALIPGTDASLLAAIGSLRGKPPGAAGAAIRVVMSGPDWSRRVRLIEASWNLERAGGHVRARGPLAPAPTLTALAAAAGACRIERAPGSGAPRPANAVVSTARRVVGNEIETVEVLLYPRSLSRSLEEVAGLLGLPVRPSGAFEDRFSLRALSA